LIKGKTINNLEITW